MATTLTITTRHPASTHGTPVVLDEAGAPLDPIMGLRAALDLLGWDNRALAAVCGVSHRTVEDWLQGRRRITAAVLNVLRDALEDRATRDRERGKEPEEKLEKSAS